MLYKYVPSDRVDILENLTLRFTPHPSLNDPFECWPRFSLAKDYEKSIEEFRERMTRQMGELVQDASPESKARADEILARGLKEVEARAASLEAEGNPEMMDSFAQGISDKRGILCLTRTWDNLLMWSHYGENHKGVVIGFDESHRFFDDESELGCDCGLRDVQYPDQRPTFDAIESFDVLTTKAPVWRYEEEVRAMRLFREEDRPIGTDPDGMPIVLVDFPKELVQQVIVGAQAEEALLARCQKALRDNEMPWVSVKKVALSRRDFSLQLEAS